MTVEELVIVVMGVSDDYQREEDQGILQRDMHKAEQALAGREACNRILRAIESRGGLHLVLPRRTGRAR